MSARIVCNSRRPASPLRVPTAQVTATTDFVVDKSAPSDTTTVEDTAPLGPRSAPISIPKSAHMNYRARMNRMEEILEQRRLRALETRINTAKNTTAANNDINPNIRALLSGLTPLSQIKNTVNQTPHPTTPQFKRPALLSPTSPLRPVLNPTNATAPTTYTPPATGPYPTTTWNGYHPIVYGGGACVAWVRAPVEPAKKVEPTPAQVMLDVLAQAHDAAAPSSKVERRWIERLVVEVKIGAWAEGTAEEVVVSKRRDSVLEGSEEYEGDEGCVCLEQAKFSGEVGCGRRCEVIEELWRLR